MVCAAGRHAGAGSYHAILGSVVVGMGIALVPESVLETFPGRGRLGVHGLPAGDDMAWTMLFWRRGAHSPKLSALAEVLAEHGDDSTRFIS